MKVSNSCPEFYAISKYTIGKRNDYVKKDKEFQKKGLHEIDLHCTAILQLRLLIMKNHKLT